ncbi:MAG: hypothetical protein WDO74_06580 [Pseudomonadota bacterium]
MPDPPDKGRPSSPLSVEDADRLADSFTPFWEDAGVPAATETSAAPAPNPGTVTAPMPAVQAARIPIGKQTLLGIAPITIEKPASASSPPAPTSSPPAPIPIPAASGLTQPLPAVAPVVQPLPAVVAPEPLPAPATAAAHPHKKTLLGFSEPTSAAAPAAIARASGAPKEAIQQSAPEVPGYAIAYVPKDPPSTPAVVIAPEAQSSPEHKPPENKRAYSQTVPSRIRSAPNASAAPLPRSAPNVSAAPLPAAAAEDFNPYAPKKAKGKVIGWGLGGALLVLVAVLGVRSLAGSDREPSAQSVPRSDVVPTATAVAAAPTPAPVEPTETAESMPTPAKPAAREPAPAAPASRRASEPAPAKAKAKTKAKAEPGAAATRPVTRAPSAEPNPTPSKAASKGVIVRDAPF